MKCPSCVGTGRDGYFHLALEPCERCNGTGNLPIEELNPSALKSATKALWNTSPASKEQPFDELNPSQHFELAECASEVIFAYQTRDEKTRSQTHE